MYNLQKNNYHQKPKASNIQTPLAVSQFIYGLLKDKIEPGIIFDPCSGQGSLLEPCKRNGFKTLGIDINGKGKEFSVWYFNPQHPRYKDDFLKWEKSKIKSCFIPSLILCNPPFNGYGNKLGSEVWLDKIIELFGKEVPIVLFVPAGFCLNQTLTSKRKAKFENGTYPPIASRITLPKNIFPEVVFHSEVLIFNIQGLEPHYFFNYESH